MQRCKVLVIFLLAAIWLMPYKTIALSGDSMVSAAHTMGMVGNGLIHSLHASRNMNRIIQGIVNKEYRNENDNSLNKFKILELSAIGLTLVPVAIFLSYAGIFLGAKVIKMLRKLRVKVLSGQQPKGVRPTNPFQPIRT